MRAAVRGQGRFHQIRTPPPPPPPPAPLSPNTTSPKIWPILALCMALFGIFEPSPPFSRLVTTCSPCPVCRFSRTRGTDQKTNRRGRPILLQAWKQIDLCLECYCNCVVGVWISIEPAATLGVLPGHSLSVSSQKGADPNSEKKAHADDRHDGRMLPAELSLDLHDDLEDEEIQGGAATIRHQQRIFASQTTMFFTRSFLQAVPAIGLHLSQVVHCIALLLLFRSLKPNL